jgi:hypothetical protein
MRGVRPEDLLPRAAYSRGAWSLDLATATGYAVAPPEAVASWPTDRPGHSGIIEPMKRPDGISFGTKVLKRDASQGHRFAQFEAWLGQFAPPGVCFIEEAIPGHASRNQAATQIAMGLRSGVYAWAFRENVQVVEVPVVTAKAWFGSKLSSDKTPMIEMARRLGWMVQTDHEADALAILDFGLAYGAQAARIFGRGRAA